MSDSYGSRDSDWHSDEDTYGDSDASQDDYETSGEEDMEVSKENHGVIPLPSYLGLHHDTPSHAEPEGLEPEGDRESLKLSLAEINDMLSSPGQFARLMEADHCRVTLRSDLEGPYLENSEITTRTFDLDSLSLLIPIPSYAENDGRDEQSSFTSSFFRDRLVAQIPPAWAHRKFWSVSLLGRDGEHNEYLKVRYDYHRSRDNDDLIPTEYQDGHLIDLVPGPVSHGFAELLVGNHTMVCEAVWDERTSRRDWTSTVARAKQIVKDYIDGKPLDTEEPTRNDCIRGSEKWTTLNRGLPLPLGLQDHGHILEELGYAMGAKWLLITGAGMSRKTAVAGACARDVLDKFRRDPFFNAVRLLLLLLDVHLPSDLPPSLSLAGEVVHLPHQGHLRETGHRR